MTVKQKAFCDRFITNGMNAKEAYLYAYGDNKCDEPTYPYKLLRKPEIKEYIDTERAKLAEDMRIDAIRVMQELGKIAFGAGNEKIPASTRVKALEILSKNLSIQTNKVEVEQTIDVNIVED